MRFKKLICAVLSAAVCLSTAACSADVSLKPPTYSESRPVTFSAYMTPPQAGVGADELRKNPDYMTAEQYGYIKDCGFDAGIAIYEGFEETTKALDLSIDAGIKYLVQDNANNTCINAIVGYAGNFAEDNGNVMPQEFAADMKSRFDAYKEKASFGGVAASDEPGAVAYDNIAFAKKWYKENYPDSEYYVNLLPYGAGAAQLGGYGSDEEKNSLYDGRSGYEKYVNDFIEKVQPDYLSYDYYALSYDSSGNPKLGIMFLNNLEIYANAAKANNLEFRNFLLTMGHWNYRTPSDYDDLAWQVYNSMAYGCRGFNTFTYWTTMSTGESITHGLIDQWGNRTQTYYSMQQLISEIRAMENVYNAFEWVETAAYIADEDYFNSMYDGLSTTKTFVSSDANPVDGVSAISADNDFLTGCFQDADGRKGYMLTNLADPAFDKSTKVEITFDGAKEVMIYRKGRTVQHALDKNGKLGITLGSGEGAFVIPLYKK